MWLTPTDSVRKSRVSSALTRWIGAPAQGCTHSFQTLPGGLHDPVGPCDTSAVVLYSFLYVVVRFDRVAAGSMAAASCTTSS